MTTHAHCSHENTKSARAACRRAGGAQPAPVDEAMLDQMRAYREKPVYPVRKGARTDIHRPAEMRPEDYTFSHCGSRAEDADPYTRRVAAEMLRALINDGHRWAAHHGAGKCDHCGAAIKHYAVMIHRPTGELIEVGETCLDHRFEMANSEFREMQNRLKAARVNRAKQARIAKTIEEHPLLAQLQEIHNVSMDDSFLGSLAAQFIAKGELSEKQIAAAEKALTREAERAAKKAEEKANMANVSPITAGKQTIVGTIVSTKWTENMYGGSLKMLVADVEGRRYWGTCPSALNSPEKGTAVKITATVELSTDDPHFGFFKRPRLVEA